MATKLNTLGRSTHSATVNVPGPRLATWALLAAGLAALLVGIAALEGARPEKDGSLDTVPVVGNSIETTLQKPIVAGFIACLVLVLFVGAVRGARLRWLASKPGAIEVADLTAELKLDAALPSRLSLRFRERMSDLHLAVPGPQPGVTPPTGFAELVGSATGDSKSVFAMVAGLIRVAWPAQAYQVQGSLITREAAEPCGVAIQVVVLGTTASPPATCWAATWEQAVDKAANHAAAFILPRTRHGRRPPWTGWHGYAMPATLLDCYERSAAHAENRRYDEALRDLYSALHLDPKNLDLRLRVGFVQEKLGLALDALDTYEGICRLGDRCRPSAAFAPSKDRAHSRTRRLAAYRSAVLLGAGEPLVEQWCRDSGGGTRREEQVNTFRERLRAPLEHLCKQRYARTVAGQDGIELSHLLGRCEDGRREMLLREVFQETSLATLQALRGVAPRALLADQTTLTRRAIELSEACVRLRLEHTKTALGKPPKVSIANVVALDREIRRVGLWLDPLEAAPLSLGAGMGRALWSSLRPHRRRQATWAERYTAASLYALGIVCGGRAENDELATRSVRQLEAAIVASGSGYVASRRAWLTSEDPDLQGLRPTIQFQRFEAIYFPSPQPTVQRPERVHDWENVQYVRGLLETCAVQRRELWEHRSERPAEWWREEEQAWRLVGEVAEHCQHWQTRLKLIDALNHWAARDGSQRPVPYPDYPEAPPAHGSETVDAAIAEARAALTKVRELAAQQTSRCAETMTDNAEMVDMNRRAWEELADHIAPAGPRTASTGPESGPEPHAGVRA